MHSLDYWLIYSVLSMDLQHIHKWLCVAGGGGWHFPHFTFTLALASNGWKSRSKNMGLWGWDFGQLENGYWIPIEFHTTWNCIQSDSSVSTYHENIIVCARAALLSRRRGYDFFSPLRSSIYQSISTYASSFTTNFPHLEIVLICRNPSITNFRVRTRLIAVVA